jgi:hypothetical protein
MEAFKGIVFFFHDLIRIHWLRGDNFIGVRETIFFEWEDPEIRSRQSNFFFGAVPSGT